MAGERLYKLLDRESIGKSGKIEISGNGNLVVRGHNYIVFDGAEQIKGYDGQVFILEPCTITGRNGHSYRLYCQVPTDGNLAHTVAISPNEIEPFITQTETLQK